MSIPVDLDELAVSIKDYPTAFLITVNDDQGVHAVQVHPTVRDGALRIGEPGRRTTANLAVRPDVTVLFPPREIGGYALLVDGRTSTPADGGAGVAITPTAAVLHRAATQPAVNPDDPEACVNDCVPLDHRHG